MGEMTHTKRLIKIILNSESFRNCSLTYPHSCIQFERIAHVAELASKEIEEQEARERGEQI